MLDIVLCSHSRLCQPVSQAALHAPLFLLPPAAELWLLAVREEPSRFTFFAEPDNFFRVKIYPTFQRLLRDLLAGSVLCARDSRTFQKELPLAAYIAAGAHNTNISN